MIAGVIGKVFAEIIIDSLWPMAAGLRALATAVDFWSSARSSAWWKRSRAVPGRRIGRPICRSRCLSKTTPSDDDDEPDLPESARVVLQQAVLLTRTDVGDLMTPRSSIVSLPSTVSTAEAAAIFRRTGLSRVPDLRGKSRRYRRYPVCQGFVRPR